MSLHHLARLPAVLALRNPDVEVISALVRAGCILVALNLRGDARAELQHSACGAAGAHAHRLERAVDAAVQQWLEDTGLTGQLAPAAQIVVQVCASAS